MISLVLRNQEEAHPIVTKLLRQINNFLLLSCVKIGNCIVAKYNTTIHRYQLILLSPDKRSKQYILKYKFFFQLEARLWSAEVTFIPTGQDTTLLLCQRKNCVCLVFLPLKKQNTQSMTPTT